MAAILKLLTRHISIKTCPILMKFDAEKQIPIKMTVISPTLKIFQIQDGRRLLCQKSVLAITQHRIILFLQILCNNENSY